MTEIFDALTPENAPDHPVTEIPGDPATGILILCDHASNEIPPEYRDLGLPRAELERHIGYDIGAAAMTEAIAPSMRSAASRSPRY